MGGDIMETFKVDLADTYNQEHHDWSVNYYTDPM